MFCRNGWFCIFIYLGDRRRAQGCSKKKIISQVYLIYGLKEFSLLVFSIYWNYTKLNIYTKKNVKSTRHSGHRCEASNSKVAGQSQKWSFDLVCSSALAHGNLSILSQSIQLKFGTGIRWGFSADSGGLKAFHFRRTI